MTSRRLGRTALLVLTTAFLAALMLPLTARPASACLVSYDYRPNIKIDLSNPGSPFGKSCSDGTSYTGMALVVALAIAALGIAGVRTVRRGTALTATSTPDQAGARRAILAGYLRAAAFPPPPSNPGAPPYPGAAPPYPGSGAPYPGPSAPYSGPGAPYPSPGVPPWGPAVPPPPAMPDHYVPPPPPNAGTGNLNPPPPGPSGRQQGGHAASPPSSERAEDQ
ncbi:MAG: hypothetical protein ACRDP6_32965 [Actinoallomurus sp.]